MSCSETQLYTESWMNFLASVWICSSDLVLFSFVTNGIQVADHVNEFGFNIDWERVSDSVFAGFNLITLDGGVGGGEGEIGEAGRGGGRSKMAAIEDCGENNSFHYQSA